MKLLKNSTYQNLLNEKTVLLQKIDALEKARIYVGMTRDIRGVLHSIKSK